MERQPTVFLSSTFYDLRQIRADVAAFVADQLGYRFLASEHLSFPIDPTSDTIENCRRRVEADADIFVLIVGGRYGYVASNAKHSVTNLEYASARAKRLPIYAFVHRDVLAVLPVWQRNPGGDFSPVVDSPQLFEFVEQVRSLDRVWMSPFETAQEIVAALRTQFAYRMTRGLDLARELDSRGAELTGLRSDALRVAVDKPFAWQSLLVAVLLEEQLAAAEGARRQFEMGLVSGLGERVTVDEIDDWVTAQSAEINRIITQLSSVVFDALTVACRASDVQGIRHAASAVSGAYMAALEWANRVRRAHVPAKWAKAVDALCRYPAPSIRQIAELPTRIRALLSDLSNGQPRDARIKVTFEVDEDAVAEYHHELTKLRTAGV